MSHTKGPWYGEPDEFGRAKGIGIRTHEETEETPLIIAFVWTEGNEVTQAANAKLIAAAPDLLEACKQAIKILDAEKEACGIYKANYELIQAAIAKAEQ